MNQNWKQVFRKMNLDADVRTMQPGDYRMLTNGSPIQPYSSSYANAVQDVVCSLLGNDLVTNSLPGGTNQVIGFLQDRKSNRAFYCVWNNTASNNSIYQYSGATGTITLVMRTALFPWAQTDFIDMDIVGDILIFTNGRSDIQKINVVKAIAGGTYTPLAIELTLIKPAPLTALTLALAYDNTVETNFLAGNYFQFFQRYIYEDYDYSVFGPSSAVTNSWLHPSGTDVEAVSNANVTLSGIQTIDGVDFAFTSTLRVLLSAQTSNSENGIWLQNGGAWTRPADYGTGTSKDVTVYVKGGALGAAQVWRVKSTNIDTAAPTLTLLLGPNYLTVTRTSTPPATVIGIEYAVRINGSNEFIVYKIEKVGSFTSSHTFYNNSYLFTVPDADTFVWNDSIPLTSKSLKVFKNRIFLFNNTEGYTHNTTTSVTLSLTAISFTNTKTFRMARRGGRYSVGVVFHDFAGRHSGVKCEATINIPDGISAYNKINVDLSSIASDIPAWAVRKTVVMTKELTAEFFIGGATEDIFYYTKDSSGAYVYSKTLTSFAAEGTLIDIAALAKEKKGYTFQQGDRIKIYDTYYTKTSIDVEILGQDGRFLLTRVIEEFNKTNSFLTTESTNLNFEIYTPKKSQQEPFFETGLSASGDIEGDVELLMGAYKCFDNSAYSSTNPYTNSYDTIFRITVPRMSAWDLDYTKWTTQSGRPMFKSDSRQINKYSYIRFGQPYIQNSNFLGINTFYALDEQALPIENGAGTRLAEAGEVLVAVHEIETEAVYVGQGFVKTDNGQNQFLTKTDNVIGDVRRYQGGYGSVNPASVVSREGKVYFVDRRNGCIVRRSQDGLTAISDYGVRGLMSTLCGIHDVLATSRIIAGWDPQYDCYCVSFIDTSGPSGYTYYFNEERNSWVFRSTMIPEFWGLLNQDQFSFKSGSMWAQTIEGNYNKFFGVQYNRSLDIEFSPLRSLIHLWDAIEIDVENIYSTSGSNEDIVLLYHKNGDTLQTKINYADFRLRESDRVWRSAFFRWINDPNFSAPDAITKSKYGSVKRIRGQSAFVNIAYNGTDRNPMKSITIFYTPSMQSTP